MNTEKNMDLNKFDKLHPELKAFAMNNKRFAEEAAKKLASHQVRMINKNLLLNEMNDKLTGLDKAKNYNRYRAIQECIALVEDQPEL